MITSQSEDHYRLLIHNASEMFWVLDLEEERFLYISPAVEHIRGYRVEEMLQHNMYEVLSSESRQYIQSILPARLQRFKQGFYEVYIDELQLTRKDGSLIWTEVTSRISLNNVNGHLEGYGVARDISTRLKIEQQVRQLSQAVQQSSASIVITDIQGSIIYVNPKFTEVTGYSYEEALGKNPRMLKTDITPHEVHADLWQTLSSKKVWRGEFCNRKKSGDLYWEFASISPILDRNGEITSYVAVKEDITERKMKDLALQAANDQLNHQLEEIQKLQEALREQAIRDPLTGLYNRRYLYETLGQEMARSLREGQTLSIMMMDVDHFKQLNDQYGHAAGDAILQGLADLLLCDTRKGDSVCRYGGEEILIAMPNTPLEQARQRAADMVDGIGSKKFAFDGKWLAITVSIGVAAYPEHGETMDAVIRAADDAMYRSKGAGRNQVTIYRLPLEDSCQL
jgi:diguanylate cyclase (GGDEF)-like protein/PAS domain S-box-containing protein